MIKLYNSQQCKGNIQTGIPKGYEFVYDRFELEMVHRSKDEMYFRRFEEWKKRNRKESK